jgi:hypothetical protein
MMRKETTLNEPKYMDEPVTTQVSGVLLDEYARCSWALWDPQAWIKNYEALEGYAYELRAEIIRRMRGDNNGEI